MKINHLNEDIVKYIDDVTGDVYQSFDGKTLQKIGNIRKPLTFGVEGDQEYFDRERQEKRDKGLITQDETEEERQKRLNRIANNRSDQEYTDKFSIEASDAVQRQKAAKAAKQYNANELNKFKADFTKFIKDSVAETRDTSWARINRKYAGSGLMRPGVKRQDNGKIPVINMYMDVSGSCQPYIETCRKAVSVVNSYVKKGQIKLNLYYHANYVTTDENTAGGGNDYDEVVKHIENTHPNNVIIMTDNGGYTNLSTTVPGAVWHLIVNDTYKECMENRNHLINHVIGEKENKYYNIKESDAVEV